ncbi:MAG: transcriptional repressor [Methylococcales bacterium]|nr:transcriptional repressor [Methylococcales bacterium]
MSHYELNYPDRLRNAGLRNTPQRQLILDSLCTMSSHASITQIYEDVHVNHPAIDRATVHRTMHLFESLGVVVSAEINHTTYWEIAGTTPHHHLICRVWGHEAALEHKHFQTLTDHLLTEHGFAAEINHLTIDGVCKQCRKN